MRAGSSCRIARTIALHTTLSLAWLLAGCGGGSGAEVSGGDAFSGSETGAQPDGSSSSDDSSTGPEASTDSPSGSSDAGVDSSLTDGSNGPSDGGSDSSMTDGPTCTNSCTAGQTQCSGSQIQTCTLGSNGCYSYGPAVACTDSHQTCTGTAGSASCTCHNDSRCAQAGTTCETSSTLDTCTADSNGCLYVSAQTTCTSPQVCSGTAPNAACSLTCTSSCTAGQTQCSGSGIQTCTLGSSGCYSYGPAVACTDSNETCTGSSGTATCTCIPSSMCGTSTGPVCKGTTLDTCSKDSNGCYYAASSTQCTTTVANAIPTCGGTPAACGFSCVSGFHDCSGACVDDTSVNTCGTSCTPCSAPANATATCNGTSCGFTCKAPYVQNGSGCTPPATRPIGPMTGNAVSTRTPTLTWALPTGFTATHVDVCTDRACSNVVWSQDVTGTSVTVGTTLPTGMVYWRLTTLDGTTKGTLVSPTWQFAVLGTHSAPKMTSWPNFADIEGDGYADFVVLVLVGGGFEIHELPGSPSGIAGVVTSSFAGSGILTGGDVNGDGFSDVVLYEGIGQIDVMLGSPTGFPNTASYTTTAPSSIIHAVVAGDVNGDGYADLVATTTSSSNQQGLVLVPGSSTGFPAAPPQPFALPAGASTAAAPMATGDVNDDGYTDVIVVDSAWGGSVGRAWLYPGSAAGLGVTPVQTIAATANYTIGGVGPSNGGTATSDLNGDGWLDLLVMGGSTGSGDAVLVYYGSATGYPIVPSVTLSVYVNGLTGGGDVNGDGYGDIFVTPGSGKLITYQGGAGGVATTASQTVTTSSNGPCALLGDVNGDGMSDYAVAYAGSPSLSYPYSAVSLGSAAISSAPSFVYKTTCNTQYW